MTKDLQNAPLGVEALISHLGGGASSLSKLGFLPGTRLTLLTRSVCGVTLRLGGIKYALGRRAVREVFVSCVSDTNDK